MFDGRVQHETLVVLPAARGRSADVTFAGYTHMMHGLNNDCHRGGSASLGTSSALAALQRLADTAHVLFLRAMQPTFPLSRPLTHCILTTGCAYPLASGPDTWAHVGLLLTS